MVFDWLSFIYGMGMGMVFTAVVYHLSLLDQKQKDTKIESELNEEEDNMGKRGRPKKAKETEMVENNEITQAEKPDQEAQMEDDRLN